MREVVWTPWDQPGMEHLILRTAADGGTEAESHVSGLVDGRPFSIRYRIVADTYWRVWRLSVFEAHRASGIDLYSDEPGSWKLGTGEPVESLEGCIDVDITATPFTNTYPIRRLQLAQGVSAEISVVYVWVPSLEVTVERQRYTCLEPDALYRFESLAGDETVFQADLPVDSDGIVVDYPDLFRRVVTDQDAAI